MLDTLAKQIFEENINKLVPWYLMGSYAYYVQDDPIFSDAFYDNMAKTIVKRWDDITHVHKELLNKDALEAGSYLGEYPSIIPGALSSLRDKYYTKSGKVRKTPKKM